MTKTVNIKSIDEANKLFGVETLHPLVSIIDFSKSIPTAESLEVKSISFDFYSIYLKSGENCNVSFGRKSYDYQEGTLVFVAPKRIMQIMDDVDKPTGIALYFHPDLLKGTQLGKLIYEYSFFNYDLSESVHLSKSERKIVLDSFQKINSELTSAIDKHSRRLIVSNIELFLTYCARFFERQFNTRDYINKGNIEKFEDYLKEYFADVTKMNIGLPTVNECARAFNFSPNYFSDMIKKETGVSAQEFIHNKVIELAKIQIFDLNKSISQVAYDLGFKYPNHFVRFFKQRVGVTPNEYRILN